MQFTAARQSEILAQIVAVSTLVTETETHDDLIAQLEAVTAERDAALLQVTQITAERDAALAEKAALQTRLDEIVAEVQALNVADAAEDDARARILSKAQGG